MRYRSLGKTGLRVSELGMGTWPLAGPLDLAGRPFGYSDVSDEQALATLHAAYEGGVTLFDTADFYGLGRAEHLLGEAFANKLDAQIVTKAGNVPDGHTGVSVDISRDHLMASLKRSLKRLKRDAVDVFLVHVVPDDQAAWDDAREALLDMKAQGLAKHTGISIAAAFDKALPFLNDDTIEVVEVYYNLFFTAYADKIHTQVRARELGILVASPFGRGMLSNTMDAKRTFAQNDVRRDWNQGSPQFQADLERRQRMEEICTQNGRTMSDAALSFSLSLDGVSSVIPGMRKLEHVETNLAFEEKGPLSNDVLDMLQSAARRNAA